MTQLVKPHLTRPPSLLPPLPLHPPLPPLPLASVDASVDCTQRLPLILYPGKQSNAHSLIGLHVNKPLAGAGPGHAVQAVALQPFCGVRSTHAPLHRFWFVPQGATPPLPCSCPPHLTARSP
jgi:hypothetical protein